jgi:hypothetical protein
VKTWACDPVGTSGFEVAEGAKLTHMALDHGACPWLMKRLRILAVVLNTDVDAQVRQEVVKK